AAEEAWPGRASQDRLRRSGAHLRQAPPPARSASARVAGHRRTQSGLTVPAAKLPRDFAELLSPAGRRVLAGRHALCGALANPRTRFVSLPGLIDKAQAQNLRYALE